MIKLAYKDDKLIAINSRNKVIWFVHLADIEFNKGYKELIISGPSLMQEKNKITGAEKLVDIDCGEMFK